MDVVALEDLHWQSVLETPQADALEPTPDQYGQVLSIGSMIRVRARYITGEAGLMPQPGYRIYVKPGWFLQTGVENEPPNDPQPPYYYYETTGSEISLQEYPLTFVGQPSQSMGAWTIKFFDFSPILIVWGAVIVGEFLLLEDIDGYSTANLKNNRRLLYNTIGNGTKLSNANPSVYNQTKNLRLSTWMVYKFDNVNDPNTWGLGKSNSNPTWRWYDRDVLNAPLTGALQAKNLCFKFSRPIGTSVFDLSTYENTRVRVRFNLDPSINDVKVNLFLFREDNLDNQIRLLENLQHSTRFIEAVPGSTPIPNSFIPAWVEGAEAFIGFSTDPTNISADVWDVSCFIDGSVLQNGVIYRLAAIVYVQESAIAPDDLYTTYSFISDSLFSNALPRLMIPEVEGYLSDFKQQLSNYVIATPQERMKGFWRLFGDLYDVNRVLPLVQAAKFVTVRVYSYEGDVKHFYDIASIGRDAFGNWNSIDRLEGTQDNVNNELSFTYFFRIRYESDIPNLFSVNTITNAQAVNPLSSMDWTNKLIYIEWELVASQTSPATFNDRLVFIQKVQVHDYDENEDDCLTLEIVDSDGDEVLNICEGATENIFLRVTDSCPQGSENKLIVGMDKKPYTINRFQEFESWDGGQLEQLQQTPYVAADADLVASVGLAEIDTEFLETNREYRAVAIVKKDVALVTPCGTAARGGLGAFNQDFSIGSDTGLVVIAYDMYEAADPITVRSGGASGPVLYSQPSLRSQGIVAVTVPPAGNGIVNIQMDNTNWWLKPFCVGQYDQDCFDGDFGCDSNDYEIYSNFNFVEGTYFMVLQAPIIPAPTPYSEQNQSRLWVSVNAWRIKTGPNAGTVNIPYFYFPPVNGVNLGAKVTAFSVQEAIINAGGLNHVANNGNPGMDSNSAIPLSLDGGYSNSTGATGTINDLLPSNDYPSGSGTLSVQVQANDEVVVICTVRPLITFPSPLPNPPYEDLVFNAIPPGDPIIPPFEPGQLLFTVQCPV